MFCIAARDQAMSATCMQHKVGYLRLVALAYIEKTSKTHGCKHFDHLRSVMRHTWLQCLSGPGSKPKLAGETRRNPHHLLQRQHRRTEQPLNRKISANDSGTEPTIRQEKTTQLLLKRMRRYCLSGSLNSRMASWGHKVLRSHTKTRSRKMWLRDDRKCRYLWSSA